MKTPILSILLAGAMSAGAVTLTINQDTPSVLDFNIEWGSPVGQYGGKFTGPGGSVIWWMGSISRNPNKYFVEIHDAFESAVTGFNLTFWTDPEYSGPVDTSLAALGGPTPTRLALDNTLYGARFLYTPTPAAVPAGAHVPDAGGTGWLLAMGVAGCALCRRMADAK